jgi:hypothetical protein
MKTLSVTIILLAFTFSAAIVQAQTADEIVNKYITALGGKEAINSVKTIYQESTLNINGNDAPNTTYVVNGKGFRNEADFGGQKFVQVVTDNGGWSITPGQNTATEMPEEQIKSSRYQIDIGGPLMDYQKKGNKVEFIGKDTACGGTYKLRVTSKEGVSMDLYIDANTSLLDRIVTKPAGQEGEASVNFSNYKKVDGGFMMPFSEEIILQQITIGMTAKSVVVNKTIDPAIFDMPK